MPKYGLRMHRRAPVLATGLSQVLWSFDDEFTGDLATTAVIGGDAPFTVDLDGEAAGVAADIDGRVITINVASTLTAGTDPFDILVTNAAGTLTVSASFVVSEASSEIVTPFHVAEVNGTISKGLWRGGAPFARGDVPAGSAVKIQRDESDVPDQFDALTYWDDGSLKLAIAKMRDTDFSANETRAFNYVKYVGSFDNTSSMTLSAALSGTDYKVEFTSITGSTTGSIPNQTFSLNTAAATLTRVTKYESGPVCDSWDIWGICTSDGTSGHLVVHAYYTVWKDAGGAIIEREFGFSPSLYWWSLAGKEKLTYTYTVKEGATTIQAYTSAQHIYRAQLFTPRMQDDHQHGRRHWQTACPSLLHKPNKVYWVKTGLVPPLNTTKTSWTNPYNNAAGKTYTPGSSQSHRAAIDAAGAYQGRGMLPNSDSIAFLSQGALDTRIARVNAFVGLHVPFHYRSNANRTRPGDAGADTAATIISLILHDTRSTSTPSSYYDFSGTQGGSNTGMPVAIHASAHSVSSPTYKGGYVDPAGGLTSGSTVWTLSTDSTHAVSYSYFMYLLEGERHFMLATLDLAMNLMHQRTDTQWGSRSVYPVNLLLGYGSGFGGAPTTQWAGLWPTNASNNIRAVGWAALIMGHAYAIVPDDDVQAACFRKYHDHGMLFLGDSWSYLPQAHKDAGDFYENLRQTALTVGGVTNYIQVQSPWMGAMVALGLYCNYRATRASAALTVGNDVANKAIGFAEERIGMSAMYHGLGIKKVTALYNATTNPHPARDDNYWHGAQITIASNVITCNRNTYWFGLTYTNGDKVIFSGQNPSLNPTPTPPEVNEGQVYYMVNASGDTFQVSATVGGSPIALANYSGTQYIIAVQLQSADVITDMRTQMISGSEDAYAPMSRCVVVLANMLGYAPATTALVDKFQTALATPAADGSSWATWQFAVPPS